MSFESGSRFGSNRNSQTEQAFGSSGQFNYTQSSSSPQIPYDSPNVSYDSKIQTPNNEPKP